MHIHILGICGTFMGSLAILARELGYHVTGSDTHVYPPMSTQLEAQGIALSEGYLPEHLDPAPDWVIIGNAMSRGNPAVEYVLERGIPYISGPQWLHEHVLQGRWVLAVAGTHGKTTTASMLAWVLEQAGMAPGYLIGGVPNNFSLSARLGETPFFVIEADEYDTAFFDKRSKFVHYLPRTFVINNLEYDHADIFPDLAAIQRQFHHGVRLVPRNGQVIVPAHDVAVAEVLEQGVWAPVVSASAQQGGGDWYTVVRQSDGSAFEIYHQGVLQDEVAWSLTGQHNVANGLMAVIAAYHVGVLPQHAIAALSCFGGVKRRMEQIADVCGIRIYDDFAHHPTAIQTTLQGLRQRVGQERIIAVIEPRSNTMRLGVHQTKLATSAAAADTVLWYQPAGLDWTLETLLAEHENMSIHSQIDALIEHVVSLCDRSTHVVIMSNGGFDGIHSQLVSALQKQYAREVDDGL